MEIEIRSWDKYNPKRDQKSYTWLRLNNDLITSPDLHNLEPLEKLIWVLVLCEASKKNAARIKLNMPWFVAHSKLTQEVIEATLNKLEFELLIEIIPDTELRSCVVVERQSTTPTYERTDVRTDVRTDGSLNNIKQFFSPSLIVDIPSETELSNEVISSQLMAMRKIFEQTPVAMVKNESLANTEGPSIVLIEEA